MYDSPIRYVRFNDTIRFTQYAPMYRMIHKYLRYALMIRNFLYTIWYISRIVRYWQLCVQVLRKVFERCRAFKLRMNPLKCAFRVFSGKFLSFLVHIRGIHADPAKATAIATMKPPATVKELKSSLGNVSYIWRFIPGLASITSAFGKLLKKGQNFEWGEAQQTAFKRLQQIMMNLPTVQALICKKPLLLYLATNQYAIGVLITQEDGSGIEQPVYYISRALKDTETRYPRAERACLAIVYAS